MNNLGWSDTSSDAILCMTFCTGCSLADLTSTDTIRHCADRGFAKTMPMHTEPMLGQRQFMSVMRGFNKMVQQQECAKVTVSGMVVYFNACQI